MKTKIKIRIEEARARKWNTQGKKPVMNLVRYRVANSGEKEIRIDNADNRS